MTTTSEQSEQQTITIRIVFDGAPYAGKTTAAYSLSDGLGGVTVTPSEEDDGRTTWFDWMTYSAGRYEGSAIRVELVTVPGQEHLSDRRRHLLGWGDVVVFIADTSRGAFAESVTKFNELRTALEIYGEVPIVVVANKRDLDDIVAIDEVRAQLALEEHELLVEGVATSGGGIRQAFIHAVRAALAKSPTRVEETTADALLDQMRANLLPGLHPKNAEDEVAVDVEVVETVGTEAVVEQLVVEDSAVDPAPAGVEVADDQELVAVDVVETIGDAAIVEELAVDDHAEALAPVYQQAAIEEPVAAYEEAVIEEPVAAYEEAAIEEPVAAYEEAAIEDPNASHQAPLLRQAHLNPEGIADGAAVVILAEHWRMLVEVAAGRSELPLSGSPEADVAAELAEWGLLTGDVVEPTFA